VGKGGKCLEKKCEKHTSEKKARHKNADRGKRGQTAGRKARTNCRQESETNCRQESETNCRQESEDKLQEKTQKFNHSTCITPRDIAELVYFFYSIRHFCLAREPHLTESAYRDVSFEVFFLSISFSLG
jgi:NADP-dependent 3-hydroxy acid dehydrogenase YdfG